MVVHVLRDPLVVLRTPSHLYLIVRETRYVAGMFIVLNYIDPYEHLGNEGCCCYFVALAPLIWRQY